LSPFASPAVNRFSTKVIPITSAKKEKTILPILVKYAATAAILLTLGYMSTSAYKNKEQKDFYASQKEVLEKKIQSATFVISNPLPTIELNVTKETPKGFHIVAGAFEFTENAEKKVKQLLKKGYNAKILGVNKWGLTQVCFDSFHSRSEAISTLNTIKKTVSKDAWLLIEQFK
jgi:cell division protein FtsN